MDNETELKPISKLLSLEMAFDRAKIAFKNSIYPEAPLTSSLTNEAKLIEQSPLPGPKTTAELITKIQSTQEILKKISTNIESFDESIVKVKEDLDTIKNDFSDLTSQKNTLFPKIKQESDRLQDKINTYAKKPLPDEKILSAYLEAFTYRARKIISPEIIQAKIEKSSTEDALRSTRYQTMQTAWTEAILNYDQVQTLTTKFGWALDILPTLHKYFTETAELKNLISNFQEILNNNSITANHVGFDHKGKARELNDKQTALIEIEKVFENIKDVRERLDTLVKNKTSFREVLLKTLTKISLELKKSVREHSQDSENSTEIINLENEKFITVFKAQQTQAQENLKQMKDTFINDWNNFCLDLNELDFDLKIIENFYQTRTTLSSFYLTAEDSYQTLRFSRIKQSSKAVHMESLDKAKKAQESLNSKVIEFNASIIEKNNFLLKQIKQPNAGVSFEDSKIGLISLDTEGVTNSTNEISKRVEAQKKSFVDKLKALNLEFKQAWNITLSAIFTHNIREINEIGKTLKISSDPSNPTSNVHYDTHFNEAFEYETVGVKEVTNIVKATGSIMGNIISKVIGKETPQTTTLIYEHSDLISAFDKSTGKL